MEQSINRIWYGWAIAALVFLLLAATLALGQTPPPDRDEVTLSGFLNCDIDKDSKRQCPFRLHYLDLEEGKTYAIRIASTEFDTHLAIENKDGKVLSESGDCMEEDVFGCIWFRPPTTGNYRFVVTSGVPKHEGFYTIRVRELPSVMRVEAALTTLDEAQDSCYFKSHEVTLNEGQRYVIELSSKDLPMCLKLLNPDGMIVAFDDEGSKTRPAHLIFEAPRTGVYTLVAASTNAYSVGAFKLTVSGDE